MKENQTDMLNNIKYKKKSEDFYKLSKAFNTAILLG